MIGDLPINIAKPEYNQRVTTLVAWIASANILNLMFLPHLLGTLVGIVLTRVVRD